MLYRQYIINIDEAAKYNVDQLIDGPLLLKILAGLNNIISCSFDNDYDCDGILNAKDVCAYTYNPQLKDYDDDGIPDVCDDDIDNDGIKNPI
ncbi:TPA: hypothetical protein DEP21_05235 [Patescibacteria group bacterium]|nr:hypothetical protein [Candidatus Gracilibacteria bacterium]